MSNVDHIIKYLSGEMKQDDAGSFEQELASNPVLKEEYENVSAWTPRALPQKLRV